jgi:hypothetical protein
VEISQKIVAFSEYIPTGKATFYHLASALAPKPGGTWLKACMTNILLIN